MSPCVPTCPHAHACAPGVVKPDTYKPVPDEPPNPTNVEETLRQIQANDAALEDVNLNNIKVNDPLALSPHCPHSPHARVSPGHPRVLVLIRGHPRPLGDTTHPLGATYNPSVTSAPAWECPLFSWRHLHPLINPYIPLVASSRMSPSPWGHLHPLGDVPIPLGTPTLPWGCPHHLGDTHVPLGMSLFP